jgi:signal transduction histidine kinase
MRDGDGDIYACLEINNNITERKKAEKALIDSESALRNSQKDLQKLAGRLISAQEEELRRLSRELHDDLTQRLAVLAIDAGKLELDLGKKPEACPEVSRKILQIKEQLISVSEDVHNISRQLHPTILDDLGLVRAIESECAALIRREDIGIIFNKENIPAVIGNDIALCLYRVLQEGLKNVITHSRTSSCEIFLEGLDNMLVLTVSDNGVGFDPAEVRNKAGLGLSSMRERAQLVRGDFSVESRSGQGTVVRIRVPLKAGDA